jgi:hypothetical protein
MLNICLAVVAGWATPAGAGFFSSTGPVIAIFAGQLFQGEAVGNLDGSGTIKIQSNTKPNITCSGQFTSSAELGGAGSLNCSDSSTATIKFQRLSIFSGYGTGSSGRGPMSFTYGLNAIESAPYLMLPPGKVLILDGKILALVDMVELIPVILPETDTLSPTP